MGGGTYNAEVLTRRITKSAAAGQSFFSHNAQSHASGVLKVHPSLDPSRKNKAGIIIRECLDSETHNNSLGIATIFDGTGSMRENPKAFLKSLPAVMPLLIQAGWADNPQMLFGVVGDETGDKVPLQIGQFEGSNEMDSALANVILEGNGQTNLHESYGLALYFMARYANLDSFNKRGKKGYLFIIGDEMPFPFVSAKQVMRIIGEPTPTGKDIPIEEVINEVERRFHLFWIQPAGTRYFNNDEINARLQYLFGQRLIRLENPALIAETIVAAVAANEGQDIGEQVAQLAGKSAADIVAKATKHIAITDKRGNSGKNATVKGLPAPKGAALKLLRGSDKK